MNDNEYYDWVTRPGSASRQRTLVRQEQAPPWETLTGAQAPASPGWDVTTLPLPVLDPDFAPQKEETHDPVANRRDTDGLRRARSRARRPRRAPVGSPDVDALTLTVVVPAYNEAAALPETLDAIMHQTTAPDRVIVVDDGSSDGTGDIARAMGAEVVRRPESLGSKSASFNSGLLECDTDIVLCVDGDTVLGADYVERIKAPFADPSVAVASGVILTWNPKGVFQRGRQTEYLLGQHLYRPVQNAWSSPTVCPGAACAFRREPLAALGGFPDGTIAEDMDYTWRAMLAGYRAVHVGGAECYVTDPSTPAQMRVQLWRWMSGYFQCLRTHWGQVIRRKPVLALLMLTGIWDVLFIPMWLATLLTLHGSGGAFADRALFLLFGIDLAVSLPVVLAAAVRRKFNPLWALASFPCIWVNRAFNTYYFTKAMIWELVLVPCGWKSGLSFFEKGH
jgi:cellulose synthase/poly-beta-1,6-N-acetylglucosamine synthase-like glycosyltransferase